MQPTSVSPEVLERITVHPFAQLLGIEVVSVELGSGAVRMTVREDMLNAMGTPHGGAIFSLADTALAVASNSYGKLAVALDVTISYCRPAPVGAILTARAVEDHRTRSTGIYNITVSNDDGKVIALARGTVFIKSNAGSTSERER